MGAANQANQMRYIFNQSKYTKENLKKFEMDLSEPMKTPFNSTLKFDKDEGGEPFDERLYSRESNFNLTRYSDADFASCKVERKSTSATCQFLGSSLVS